MHQILRAQYRAAQAVVPGYGGGMSSAKAQLESDTRYMYAYMYAWKENA